MSKTFKLTISQKGTCCYDNRVWLKSYRRTVV